MEVKLLKQHRIQRSVSSDKSTRKIKVR